VRQDGAAGIGWVDSFVQRIKPHIYVRETDRVLIRMPNRAFKLNAPGCRMLKHLLNGGRVADLLEAAGEERASEIASFFGDLSRMLNDAICEKHPSAAIETVPFRLGYIELPVLSEVALTWRCNVRCRFCYAGCEFVGRGEVRRKGELSTRRFRRVLDVIRRDAEVPSVSFTGGEPCLRTDLVELTDYAHGTLGMRVNLITNGTLVTRDLARRLADAGLASAQVSIESPAADVHDAITGVPGSHAASVRGLVELREAGISVHPHATLCRLNCATAPQMAAFAKELGADRFSLNLVIPAGRGVSPELTVAYSEVRSILIGVMEEAEKHSVRFMWYSPTPICLFNPISHQLGNKGCSACEGLLSIDPAGRVLPCSSWKEPVGDLLAEGFRSIWFGSRAKTIRDKGAAHPECRRCEHFAVCHGACPLYFRNHGYAEIEPCLKTFATRSN